MEAQTTGAKIFFVDETHFRADVELRARSVLRGEPALVDSTNPRRGEKATYYSAVCLETGKVESMVVSYSCHAETPAAFLRQLHAKHAQPLMVIWDNSPAYRGPEIRDYLATPNLSWVRSRLGQDHLLSPTSLISTAGSRTSGLWGAVMEGGNPFILSPWSSPVGR